MNALKRHFKKDLRAERISFTDPILQGFRAFDPNQRAILADKYAERFPRTPVDWQQDKWGARSNRKGSYNELDRQLQRQRSGEDLPPAKAQRTLHR